MERIGRYSCSDGSGGIAVDERKDVEEAMARALEQPDTPIGLDMDATLPQTLKAQVIANG
jgi:hypothetical protein